MPWYSVETLSPKHLGEISLTVERGTAQWLKGSPTPAQAVAQLERVLLFLKQNGGASRQAQHVTSLALIFGEQVCAVSGWRWMNVSDDGRLNPGLVSADGAHACLPVDVVTRLLMRQQIPSLGELFTMLVEGPLPTVGAQPTPVLVPSE